MTGTAPGESREEALATAASNRSSLALLLVTLLILQFAYPITLEGPGWNVAYLLAYAGAVVYAVRTASVNPRRHWPITASALVLIIGATWFGFNQEEVWATRGFLVGVGLLQTSLLFGLLAALARPPEVIDTQALLLVAVCGYLLLGGLFGVISSLLELGVPGSFGDGDVAAPLSWQSLYYGSYVTLATLGFGDIVPVSAWARSLWSFEAVVGTLYVAVVIARLVGLAGTPSAGGLIKRR